MAAEEVLAAVGGEIAGLDDDETARRLAAHGANWLAPARRRGPTDAAEAMTIVLAITFGLTLPMSPAQIIWVNMVTSVALGLTLVFEPTEPGTMRRPPRRRDEPLLTGPLIRQALLVAALVVAGAFGSFAWAEARRVAA